MPPELEHAQQMQAQLEKTRRGDLNLAQLEGLVDMLARANRSVEALEVQKIYTERQKETLTKEIEARDEQIEMKNEQLEVHKNNAEISREIMMRRIENVYLSDGKASFPGLTLNDFVEPSVEGHHFRGMDPQKAPYDTKDYTLDQFLQDVKVPTRICREEGQTALLLSSEFHPLNFPLKYTSEIEIQVNVRCLVLDAIACLGYQGVLDTSMEFSFYGVTPDIVVICQGRKIVFVVEVKAPNRTSSQTKTNNNVFEHELVGGQLWLYLMSMKQAGVKKPLGAICTFNQIRIVSLDPLNSHCFNEATNKLNSDTVKAWKQEQRNDSKQGGKPSPDPSRELASEKSKKFSYNDVATSIRGETCTDAKVFPAKLYGSKTYSTDQVFPTLLLGLMTAKMEVDEDSQTQETITEVKAGDDLSQRLFAFVTEKSLRFARTPQDFSVKNDPPNARSKRFFLLDAIGAGSSGEVSLAVNISGCPAAVKFYHLKPSRQATAEQRKKENEERLNEVKAKRDEEVDLWKSIYPGRARSIRLAGVPCLLMPYGTRITATDRKKWLESIERELERFSQAGYSYKESDLRWRHVMIDMKGQLFLADLGSLKKMDEGADHAVTVKAQMEYLKKHMTNEGTYESSIAVHQSPSEAAGAASSFTLPGRQKRGRTSTNNVARATKKGKANE